MHTKVGLKRSAAYAVDSNCRLLNVTKAENERDIYLVFEYMETDLHAVLRANILEDIHKRYIMYQLFRALKYLHSADLLHRDVKVCSGPICTSDCQWDFILEPYAARRYSNRPMIWLVIPVTLLSRGSNSLQGKSKHTYALLLALVVIM